ncbi:enoyl-CoA hydratase/isomerase family protein [Bradyrhizobium sp. LHD-71]|uniref:enoyl-CoA hydratase/isomerase family protein n=1 Tax=Bradyrhizobium sp. LHD-71 TaxID=3072141 RepID=UPI00280C5C48|nr:enoyl-CoA hydratase/isomerase family protein [Bradyrhizobium sp. LHD-71]MDQ8728189.1 enoyl-CoA hydratase/isomerase family protein [Bradyrhizobium sp. LHD-71]
MQKTYETVALTTENAVATILLNRPDKRNALNYQMCLDLLDAVRAVDADDSIRLVLVRGAGPTFCAGADVAERKGVSTEWLRNRRMRAFAAYDALQDCGKPCIAVAHGPVIGSGAEIATACDFVLASDLASFRYPETVRGSVGAGQRLLRIVGKAMAKELLFTGRTIPAAEALRIGLVNRVVPMAELEGLVAETVQQILGSFPLSVSLMKRCIDWGAESDLRTGMAYERLAIDRLLATGEWKQGVDNFITEMATPRDRKG